VGATLSSNIIRFHRDNGSWAAEKVIDVANEELEGWTASPTGRTRSTQISASISTSRQTAPGRSPSH
jgi:hypothetical protein